MLRTASALKRIGVRWAPQNVADDLFYRLLDEYPEYLSAYGRMIENEGEIWRYGCTKSSSRRNKHWLGRSVPENP